MNGPEARPGLHAAAAGERAYDLVSLGACRVELWSDAPLGTAASRIELGDTDLACIANTRMILLSGITQAVSVAGERATLQAARLARDSSVLVAFDPNHLPRLWSEREGGDPSDGAQAARHAFASLLDSVDVLLPSLPSDGVLWDGEGDPLVSLRHLRTARGVPLVAAKAGPDGAFLIEGERVRHVPVQDRIDPLDTTGAGNACNAAFLHQLGAGRPVEDAAVAAHGVARSVLEHRGAIAPPA